MAWPLLINEYPVSAAQLCLTIEGFHFIVLFLYRYIDSTVDATLNGNTFHLEWTCVIGHKNQSYVTPCGGGSHLSNYSL